jgi:hypothetical protein
LRPKPGILVEAHAATGIALREVVAARAAHLVVRGDLACRAVGHRTAEVADLQVEDAVALAELAEVQVAPELVGEERVPLEEPGRAAAQRGVGGVDGADARLLDRATGAVDVGLTGADHRAAFGELRRGRPGEKRCAEQGKECRADGGLHGESRNEQGE